MPKEKSTCSKLDLDAVFADDAIDAEFTVAPEEKARKSHKKLPANAQKKVRTNWTPEKEERARSMFVRGYSYRQIGEAVGITYPGVLNKAKRENWASETKTPKKLLGEVAKGVENIVRSKSDAELSKNLEREIDKRLTVVGKHQDTLSVVGELILQQITDYTNVDPNAPGEDGQEVDAVVKRANIAESIRVIKMAAEALTVVQKAERAAWYLDQATAKEIIQPIQINNFTENKFTEVVKRLLENV